MIIVNQSKTEFIFDDVIESVFVGEESGSIRVNLKSGRGFKLAKYATAEANKIAMQIVLNNIAQGYHVIYMPKEEEVDDKIRQLLPIYKARNLDGKKPERRGGS